MKKIETRLFIEENKHTEEHSIVLRIGPFQDKEDALNAAGYIYMTNNLDFSNIISFDPTIINRTIH